MRHPNQSNTDRMKPILPPIARKAIGILLLTLSSGCNEDSSNLDATIAREPEATEAMNDTFYDEQEIHYNNPVLGFNQGSITRPEIPSDLKQYSDKAINSDGRDREIACQRIFDYGVNHQLFSSERLAAAQELLDLLEFEGDPRTIKRMHLWIRGLGFRLEKGHRSELIIQHEGLRESIVVPAYALKGPFRSLNHKALQAPEKEPEPIAEKENEEPEKSEEPEEWSIDPSGGYAAPREFSFSDFGIWDLPRPKPTPAPTSTPKRAPLPQSRSFMSIFANTGKRKYGRHYKKGENGSSCSKKGGNCCDVSMSVTEFLLRKRTSPELLSQLGSICLPYCPQGYACYTCR